MCEGEKLVSLQQIWIMQISGTCLFHKKYDNNTNDENLISGFLSAVNSFVGSFGAEMKWIETNKIRFVFNINDQLIFVASTSTDANPNLTYKRLVRISEHFNLMFDKKLFESGNSPIPIDMFRKIAPTVNRLFALPDNSIQAPVIPVRQQKNYGFDSPESRLVSFIRYKRKVSINDIVHYLRISNEEANDTVQSLEQRKHIMRVEFPDGSEQFELFPVIKSAF